MDDLWALFCGHSECAGKISDYPCNPQFVFLTHPSSCINHGLSVCYGLLFLAVLLWTFFSDSCYKQVKLVACHTKFPALEILSAVFNGCLGLVYIGIGIWVLEEKLRNDHSITPIHLWILLCVFGVKWLLLGSLTRLVGGELFKKVQFQILSILDFLFTGILCFLSLYAVIVNREKLTVETVLEIMSFLGASLLLLCTYKVYKEVATCGHSTLYMPLNSEDNSSRTTDFAPQVTPFGTAGLFSKMSFSWLNPLLKLGREKPLLEDDIPKLRDIDTAKSCFFLYLDQLEKQKETDLSEFAILRAIVACHKREILVSGVFAFFKTLAVSVGPTFLNSFIKVAGGEEYYKYEGYLLAILLLLSKVLEAFSQSQWFFQSKLIGLKVKSMLIAAIYKKQLRLSSVGKRMHTNGEIMSYATVDAYRIGEFPYWLHQIWAAGLQLIFASIILFQSLGLATIASLILIILTVLCNAPLGRLQHDFQTKLMAAQDERLKACSEALVNMKVLKLYGWNTHFKNVVDKLRKVECKWLSAVQSQKGYNCVLYWLSPVLVSAATFGACYLLRTPLNSANVFTFLANLRLAQIPIQTFPDIMAAAIQARVAFGRIVKFLAAPELQIENIRKKNNVTSTHYVILMKSVNISWEMNQLKPTLRNLNLSVHPGEKVAICGEVGCGKSTLLAALLGEVLYTDGVLEVYGRIAYVSQTAWIRTGTIRENILFGCTMDEIRYQETLQRCSLVKDLELLPYGDMTEIGERGVNLSGGQKQRIQLARALYQDADIYLLDDPFSAVDAHTASSLFNEYIMEGLRGNTVLLVTHQVDFLPAFHCCLLMSDGEILQAGTYNELLDSSPEFLALVTAHKETSGTSTVAEIAVYERHSHSAKEVKRPLNLESQYQANKGEQLIKREEREVGDAGFKPYLIYLRQKKGFWYISILVLSTLAFVINLILQNIWMASAIDNPRVSKAKLIVVYVIIGLFSILFSLCRSLSTVKLGMETSKSLFDQLINSLFRAPMSFYDSTPLGRILSRISSDLSIVDLDIPFSFFSGIGSFVILYSSVMVLALVTWQVLLVCIPAIYMAVQIQIYYFATAKELMRLNGTTSSLVANHLAESVAGAVTIRAFEEEDRFFAEVLDLIDTNASALFHNYAANEWLVQRIDTLCATILAAAGLCMVWLPPGTLSSGFIGMSLTYGLALNLNMVYFVQLHCTMSNRMISVERLNQYMDIISEAPEFVEGNSPPQNWPSVGTVEICNLQIRYRPNTPLVLRGISCTFEGGGKIGIVGRTGSGKTTLTGALFRLVEPVGGKIIVDGIDICSVGLQDIRSRFGIIPQDPTLFNGTVRFNLDPLGQHNDDEIWKVLEKCQLKEVVQNKEQGLDSSVVEDGSNWSLGQRQLLCLGRALLRRSKLLVLDEATASIDNATDLILQKTIRTEFADCTVITVAHRIPTVMDCTKVLAISDGKLMEYDEPMKLMQQEGSLFAQLVKEYWSHFHCSSQFIDI